MVMVNLPDNSDSFFPVIHPGHSQIQVALPNSYNIFSCIRNRLFLQGLKLPR